MDARASHAIQLHYAAFLDADTIEQNCAQEQVAYLLTKSVRTEPKWPTSSSRSRALESLRHLCTVTPFA